MTRARSHWFRHSTWIVPLAYAGAGLLAGFLLPRFEYQRFPGSVAGLGAASAMSMCSAISSGMIALTGIVFSMVFVMVQFSATAYSPRLVLWVARDQVVSHALGVFVATFLYSLMLMAWLDRDSSGKVPLVSGWMTLLLLLASMGLFIALVQRISVLQVNRMLILAGDQGRKAIAELYAGGAALAKARPSAPGGELPPARVLNHIGRPQVLQAIHVAKLVELASAVNAFIEIPSAVGDTLLESTPLLRVHGARAPLDETALRAALEVGDERTFEQDPKYALRIVVDIAIKALSPAINDPTTAVQALDQIEDLLLRLGRQELEIGAYHDAAGALRVRVHFPTWDDFLLLALDEIRSCGASSVQVMRRMHALIKNLVEILPPTRRPSLQHWEERLEGTVERTFASAEERQDASVADRQGLGIGEEHPEGT